MNTLNFDSVCSLYNLFETKVFSFDSGMLHVEI